MGDTLGDQIARLCNNAPWYEKFLLLAILAISLLVSGKFMLPWTSP
jgi:hypothetical protein